MTVRQVPELSDWLDGWRTYPSMVFSSFSCPCPTHPSTSPTPRWALLPLCALIIPYVSLQKSVLFIRTWPIHLTKEVCHSYMSIQVFSRVWFQAMTRTTGIFPLNCNALRPIHQCVGKLQPDTLAQKAGLKIIPLSSPAHPCQCHQHISYFQRKKICSLLHVMKKAMTLLPTAATTRG